MFEFLKTLFNPAPPSGNTAKERLRLVLLSDHLSLAPDVVDALKRDLLAVISRYVTIDSAHADVTFEHRDNEVAMMANIPITGVRERAASAPVAVAERVERVPDGLAIDHVPEAAQPAPAQAPLVVEAPADAVAAVTTDDPATPVPVKSASRRRRRKKASNALATAAERKAPVQNQPGYSAQA